MWAKSRNPLSTLQLMQSHTTCTLPPHHLHLKTNTTQVHTPPQPIPCGYRDVLSISEESEKEKEQIKAPCHPRCLVHAHCFFFLLLNWFGEPTVHLMERLPAPKRTEAHSVCGVTHMLQVTALFVCCLLFSESRGNICSTGSILLLVMAWMMKEYYRLVDLSSSQHELRYGSSKSGKCILFYQTWIWSNENALIFLGHSCKSKYFYPRFTSRVWFHWKKKKRYVFLFGGYHRVWICQLNLL